MNPNDILTNLAVTGLASAANYANQRYNRRSVPLRRSRRITAQNRRRNLRGSATRTASRKPYKRRGKYIGARTSQTKKLKKKVDNVAKLANATTGTRTIRRVNQYKIESNPSECKYENHEVTSVTIFEDILNPLRFYDPNTNGIVQKDAAAGSYERDFMFTNITSKLTIRSNYLLDVVVTVYCCQCRADSNITPSSAFVNGITDQTDSGATNHDTNPYYFPTDVDLFNQLWNSKSTKLFLPAGAQKSIKCAWGPVEYSPAATDGHTSEYQRKTKDHVWLIRVEGTLGHENAAPNNVTTMAAGIDVRQVDTYTVKYAAGTDVKDYKITFSKPTITQTLTQTKLKVDNESIGQ